MSSIYIDPSLSPTSEGKKPEKEAKKESVFNPDNPRVMNLGSIGVILVLIFAGTKLIKIALPYPNITSEGLYWVGLAAIVVILVVVWLQKTLDITPLKTIAKIIFFAAFFMIVVWSIWPTKPTARSFVQNLGSRSVAEASIPAKTWKTVFKQEYTGQGTDDAYVIKTIQGGKDVQDGDTVRLTGSHFWVGINGKWKESKGWIELTDLHLPIGEHLPIAAKKGVKINVGVKRFL